MVGGWRRLAVGGLWLVTVDGPGGLSLRAVLNKENHWDSQGHLCPPYDDVCTATCNTWMPQERTDRLSRAGPALGTFRKQVCGSPWSTCWRGRGAPRPHAAVMRGKEQTNTGVRPETLVRHQQTAESVDRTCRRRLHRHRRPRVRGLHMVRLRCPHWALAAPAPRLSLPSVLESDGPERAPTPGISQYGALLPGTVLSG